MNDTTLNLQDAEARLCQIIANHPTMVCVSKSTSTRSHPAICGSVSERYITVEVFHLKQKVTYTLRWMTSRSMYPGWSMTPGSNNGKQPTYFRNFEEAAVALINVI